MKSYEKYFAEIQIHYYESDYKHGLWSQIYWFWILVLQLTSFETICRLLKLSVPQISYLQNEDNINISLGFHED